jgi:NADH dehydrogenase
MTGLVTVFGGSGFVGRYVVRDLLSRGWRVRVAVRHPREALFLKPQGGLGQTQFMAADVTKAATLARACADVDAVINLVGSFENVDAIQHVGASNIAAAAHAAGAKSLVHVSAIGADIASASAYGRSKGEGEAAVRVAFPTAALLRPSLIFGREDAFTNRFAKMMVMMPVVPIARGAARFQPVYVADVAGAVVAALGPAAAGQTYELGGPDVLTMAEIQHKLADYIERKPAFIDMPDALMALAARMTGWLPGAPITWDQWLMLQSDNVVASAAKGMANLGITPTPMDAVAPGWLVLYRKHGRFSDPANTKVAT